MSLKRNIGLLSATAIGIGTIIGAGIFVVTGIAANLAGPAIVISMTIAGAIAILNALSFTELSAYLPKEGGVYAFGEELISPHVGFVAGWMWIFSNIFVGAAVSLGFAHYSVSMFPALPVKAVAAVICFCFLLLNYFGVRRTALLNNMLVSIKIVILIFFIALGSGHLSGGNFTPFAPNSAPGILQASALIFFAFTGFARITTMAEEVKDPTRTIPRSIILALAISTVIYLLVGFVAIGLVGYVNLASTESPLAEAISITGMEAAVILVSIGAMIATASVLLTTVLGVSRVTFAMARNDDLPKLLSRIHHNYGTPQYAIWITGALMLIAIVFGDLNRVVAVSAFASLVYYFIADLAALRIPAEKRRYPSLIPIAGFISCIFLLAFLTVDSWLIGIIGLMIGLVFYQAYKKLGLLNKIGAGNAQRSEDDQGQR